MHHKTKKPTILPRIIARLIPGVLAVIASQPAAQTGLTLPASRGQVQAVAGTDQVKLIFTFDKELYLVDYSQPEPQIRKLNGMTNAYYPVISPDGQWITYQTGINLEGTCLSNCASSIWIRPLAVDGTPVKICDNGYVPRFVDNPADGNPEVVYATSLQCPTEAYTPWWPSFSGEKCWRGGQTLKRKIIGGTSVQDPEVVFAGGSFYGGLSYDQRYLCTAWPGSCPNPAMIDVKSGTTTPQLMHVFPVKNKTSGVDSTYIVNCCNPSRSPSRIFTNTMMYFDFGFSGGGKYEHALWGTWAQHQVFFISRMTAGTFGEQIRIYGLPTDQPLVSSSTAQGTGEPLKAEWINPEWSNHPYFATMALLVDRLYKNAEGKWAHTYNNEGVYIVNLRDNTGLRLVQTTEVSLISKASMTYPYLWVKVPDGFQEDPAWLASVRAERSAVPVRQPSAHGKRLEPAHIGIRNNMIASSRALSRVTVFSGLGEVVWDRMDAQERIPMDGLVLPSCKPGVYFVKTEMFDAESRTLRWVVR